MAQLGGYAGLLVVENDRFHNLQRQLVSRQSCLLQRAEEEAVEIGLAQFRPRDVDGDPPEGDAGAVPFGRLGDRLGNDDAADVGHQAALFGDGDELTRRDHTPAGVPPAHKCLDSADSTVHKRDLRLEMDLERPVGDGRAQILFKLLAVVQLETQFLRKEGERAAAELLGRIERKIRMDHEVLGVVGVDRIDGYAAAGARQNGGALEDDRLVDARQDAFGHHVDVFGAAGGIEDHDELVAAEAHAQIRSAAGFAHALRGHYQHVVTCGVAERVVDLLEAVEVELDDGQPLAPAVCALDERVEMVGQEGSVVQARQPVVHGKEGHRVARVDQFARSAQDGVRHRPEDEYRHQHDHPHGGEEQPTVHVENALHALIGHDADALAEGGIA